MSKSSVCDGPKFTVGLESSYRNMWRRYCKGDVPSLRRMEMLKQQQQKQVISEEPCVTESDPTRITIPKEGSFGIKTNGFSPLPPSSLDLSTTNENGVS